MARATSPEDPLLRDARREGALTLVLWAAALAYTLLYCSGNAYARTPESLTFVLGFPDWVFWGVLVPWGASLVLTAAFALLVMKDADLGDAGR
jgi:uncharacterized protein DUF997